MSNIRAVGTLLVLACMWSSSFTVIKFAVPAVPPVTLVALRTIVAAIFLYGFLRIQGKTLPPWGRGWMPYVFIGIAGNCVPFFLIGWGEVGISSGQAVILLAIMPLVTLLLAHFFTISDRITATKLVGLFIGLGGVLVLFGPDALEDMAGSTIRRLAVAGAAVSYAVAVVLSKRLPGKSDSVVAGTAMTFCATAIIIPISLLVDQPWNLRPDTAQMVAGVYLGIVPTALASIIYFHLIAARGTTFFSVINYIIPCMGVVWGYLFLDEIVPPQSIVALGIILIGVAVANFKRRP
jgi:drug/metabolite transporter (DMT)-like permease